MIFPDSVQSIAGRPDGQTVFEWEPPEGARRVVVYRLDHPLLPQGTRALFSGALDLLLRRFELPADVTAFRDGGQRQAHYVILLQRGEDELLAVTATTREPLGEGETAGELERMATGLEGWRPSPLGGAPAEPREMPPGTRGPRVTVDSRPARLGTLGKPPEPPMSLADARFDLQRELRKKTDAWLRNRKDRDEE